MEAQSNNSINHRLDKIEQTLERLESALLGDKYNGRGYKGRLEDAEERLDALEKAKDRNSAFETVAKLAIGAAIGGVVLKFLEHFLK